jgi:hypothetical protein
MTRINTVLVFAAALAAPAAAYSIMVAPNQLPQPLCFASGASTYRIVTGTATPDYRIRFEDDAVRPDLRVQLVDRAEHADFVLVDDFSGSEQNACRSSTPVRTVAVDTDAQAPDVTVQLSDDIKGADYRLFVHSARFSQQDAAALLAAIWKADQRRQFAARNGH